MDPWSIAFAVAGAGAIAALAVAQRARSTASRVGVEADELRASLDGVTSEARRSRDILADQLEDGLIDVDTSLEIIFANPAAHRLLGRPALSLTGRTVLETFLDADAEPIVARAIADGSAAGELRSAERDGRVLVVQARRSPSGGATLLLRDVSELRRLQRIRTEFIDNLSHELRTPLTTVSLLAETLSREAAAIEGSLPGKMRDRIAKIEIETGHLVQMVNELLDLSRIESGTSLGTFEMVDVGALAEHAAERLRLFAERQGVAISVDVAAGMPAVQGDPERLGQVVVNLVHNAIKFSPDGGAVTLSVRPADSGVALAVVDHGVGIPRSAHERIFERFYKVDRARSRDAAGGTGLGLSIARHVIEQHGGRISVESIEGHGSTFTIELPVAGA